MLTVYGIACPIIWDTGVGKLARDGPRSPRSSRPQNAKYCWSGVPDSPYISVRASRMASTDCASRTLPLAITMAICASTGSVGESRGMIKVIVIPTKMIVKN